MFARTMGSPGAVTAMFTYRPGAGGSLQLVQEADLEILTRDPQTHIQFTNQPSWNSNGDVPAATRNVTLPSGRRWSEWAHYRMGLDARKHHVVHQRPAGEHHHLPGPARPVPGDVQQLGATAAPGAASCRSTRLPFLQIQWLEMLFNNTDSNFAPKPGSCTAICSIDETPQIGTPVLIVAAGTRPLVPFLLLAVFSSLCLS